MPTDPQSWNIPDIVAAVIAEDLAHALAEAKAGRFARKTIIAPKQSDRAQHA